MRLFYVDESGNTGARLTDREQPVFCLAAVGIPGDRLRAVEEAMGKIADTECKGVPSYRYEFEFKGIQIYNGTGPFKGVEPPDRVRIYERLVRLLAEHELDLFCVDIHKQRHLDRATKKGYSPLPPQQLAFMYLAEELDRWLGGHGKEDGLVVADSQPDIEATLQASFGWWRKVSTDFGYKTRRIKYLVDTIHYVPSHSSWLIQLADCVAYLRNRFHRVRRKPPEERGTADEATERLWKRCREQLWSGKVWPGSR